ncbi:MAG: ABC transporter ATP-binding protein [Candidatus Neomarinimicrobiota bacterium]
MILRAEHISKSYPTGDGPLLVLRDVNLSVDEGELVSVAGPSGCGKSTLLNILGTLDRPDSGELWITEHRVSDLKDTHLSKLRNKTIGFVFQFHHLLPEFTVLENLMIPQLVAGVSREDASKRGVELLAEVNLGQRKDHKPRAISGGERQRVAVLRALVNHPRLVLADEPTGNLDQDSGRTVMDMMKHLVNVERQGYLIVTHNPVVASECENNLILTDGELRVQDEIRVE